MPVDNGPGDWYHVEVLERQAAAVAEVARAADEAASIAHDFVYGLKGVTQEQASAAIWQIHSLLRPLYADSPAAPVAVVVPLVADAEASEDSGGAA